jgi:hypothetical protein
LSQYLGKVHGPALRKLGDLFAATEAVGDDQRSWAGPLDCRQQAELR